MPAIICIESPGERVQGFKYLWAKRVTGFSPSRHCAPCLRGHYEESIGLSARAGSFAPANSDLALSAPEGSVVYLCGVADTGDHSDNLHVAFRVRSGCQVATRTHLGHAVEIIGGDIIPFDDSAARKYYGERSSSFLRCRNFQFAAQMLMNETPLR